MAEAKQVAKTVGPAPAAQPDEPKITAEDLDVEDDYEPELSVDLGDLDAVLEAEADEEADGLLATLREKIAFTKRAQSVVRAYNEEATVYGPGTLEEPDADMGIMGTVRLVGAAVVGISVTVLVVNEVLTIGAIQNSSGPFAPVIDSIGSTGVAAMSLLVVGLLVLAASRIMGFMGSGF
jgi:hypothetical protein